MPWDSYYDRRRKPGKNDELSLSLSLFPVKIPPPPLQLHHLFNLPYKHNYFFLMCRISSHFLYLISKFYKRNLPFFYMIKYEISCLKNTIFYPSINRKIRSTYSSYFLSIFSLILHLYQKISIFISLVISLFISISLCNISLSLSLSLSLYLPLIWFLVHSASLYFTIKSSLRI